MKVVHIISGLATGGAEQALLNLLSGGLSAKFDNHVISLGDGGTIGPEIEKLGVPVSVLNLKSINLSFTALSRLKSLINIISPDVIQGWMYHGNLVALFARTLYAKNAVLVWNIRHSLYGLKHEKLLTRFVILSNRFLSGFAGTLLYNSHESRKQHENFGFSVENAQVIPNGINVDRFSFSIDQRMRVREDLSIPDEAMVVGHVARLHPVKDHGNFFNALELVAARCPDVHFLLVGRGLSINNRELMKIFPDGVDKRIHLLGERNNISSLMSAMDVFCQSSMSEAFPNVLGEAMATGIPCVATNVGDSAFIVKGCGEIVPLQNSRLLAAGIESILALTNVERRQLGKKARQRIVENFSLDAAVEKYTRLYTSVCFGKARR